MTREDITNECRRRREMLIKVGRITLNDIAGISYENAKKRQENGAHINVETRAMLKHCATEVVEAMEAYTKIEPIGRERAAEIRNFAAELADVICCCTIIAAREHIDLDRAVAGCLEKNRLRAEGRGDKK